MCGCACICASNSKWKSIICFFMVSTILLLSVTYTLKWHGNKPWINIMMLDINNDIGSFTLQTLCIWPNVLTCGYAWWSSLFVLHFCLEHKILLTSKLYHFVIWYCVILLVLHFLILNIKHSRHSFWSSLVVRHCICSLVTYVGLIISRGRDAILRRG